MQSRGNAKGSRREGGSAPKHTDVSVPAFDLLRKTIYNGKMRRGEDKITRVSELTNGGVRLPHAVYSSCSLVSGPQGGVLPLRGSPN